MVHRRETRWLPGHKAYCLVLLGFLLLGAGAWYLVFAAKTRKQKLSREYVENATSLWKTRVHALSASDAEVEWERAKAALGDLVSLLPADQHVLAQRILGAKYFRERHFDKAFAMHEKASELCAIDMDYEMPYMAGLARRSDWLQDRAKALDDTVVRRPLLRAFVRANQKWARDDCEGVVAATDLRPSKSTARRMDFDRALAWTQFLRAKALSKLGKHQVAFELAERDVLPRAKAMSHDRDLAVHMLIKVAEIAELAGENEQAVGIATIVARYIRQNRSLDPSWAADRKLIDAILARLAVPHTQSHELEQ